MPLEMLFKPFNSQNTTEKRLDKEQIPKKIGNNISDKLFVVIKWKTIKNNTKKKETKN